MTTERLETFADGVFAIAATLLIIDVGLAQNLHESLGRELLDIWPQYAAYAISFAIGIMWVNSTSCSIRSPGSTARSSP